MDYTTGFYWIFLLEPLLLYVYTFGWQKHKNSVKEKLPFITVLNIACTLKNLLLNKTKLGIKVKNKKAL